MPILFSLFINILPLYALIAAGYAAVRFLHVDRESLATLAIYIFVPVVVFGFIAKLDFEPTYLLLPCLVFAIQCVIILSFLKLGKIIYGDSRANLLAICSASGNMGYFGLPVVLLLFPENLVALYVFMLMGGIIYESTICYYIAARGNFSVKESFIRLLKFPSLYAIIAGLAWKTTGIEMPELFWTYWTHFKGAYVIVGMMIIGGALGKMNHFAFAPRFVSLVFVGKFIVFPAMGLTLIMLDSNIFHLFTPDIHRLFMIICIVPIAANMAAFAIKMKLDAERAASTILLSTIFALFYIPAIVWLMGMS